MTVPISGRAMLACVMACSIPLRPPLAYQEASRTWSNVMYLGGAEGVRGKALNWDNALTVSADTITFHGKSDLRFELDTAVVCRLTYSGHTHSSDGAATAGLIAGGLVGMLVGSAVKSTDHYVLVEYELHDGTIGGMLFRLHKDNHQEIIATLYEVTKHARTP